MTFETELVRVNYHLLPTDKQLEYMKLEREMNSHGKHMHITAVMFDETRLEICFRVSEKLHEYTF